MKLRDIDNPLVLTVLCAAALGIAVAASWHPGPREASSATGSLVAAGGWSEEDTAHWRSRIQAVGGTSAYKEFSAALSKEGAQNQHGQAHYFGRLLYVIEGVEGVVVCDANFSMGCYHEFLGDAIAHEGRGVVPRLAQRCDKLATAVDISGCQHGIGHGIQAYLGYAAGNLLDALSMCRALHTNEQDVIGGCKSGAFMEYNLRTMISLDASAIRPETNNDKLCDLVQEEDRAACIFWLPQWWASIKFASLPPANYVPQYKDLGAQCHALGLSRSLQDYCFQGVGATLSDVVPGWPETAIAGCQNASDSPREQLLCRAFAAGIQAETIHDGAKKMCEGLEGESLAYCDAYATGAADFINQIPVPLPY